MLATIKFLQFLFFDALSLIGARDFHFEVLVF